MLKVYCGNDTVKVRQAALAAVEAVEAAGARVTLIDGDSYQPGMLQDAVGATSLFGDSECYLIDTSSGNKELAGEIDELLAELAQSVNTFVVIEGVLLAPAKKPYQKYAQTFEECKAVAGERFNSFALADALAQKDKKSLWLLLQQAKAAGLVEEELIGVLWWQLKTLRLAAVTKSASEAGLKEFPYNKAKRSLAKFKPGELETISLSLLSLYHEGHAGVADIDLALERWVLTL